MKRIGSILLCFLCMGVSSQAQLTRYLIKFRYKGVTSFTLNNPSAFLSQRSIDRRLHYSIAIDSTDLPVNPLYLSQIAAVPGAIILNASKWLNQVSIQVTDQNAVAVIQSFYFVSGVSGIASRVVSGNNSKKTADEIFPRAVEKLSRLEKTDSNFYNYGASSLPEMQLHHAEFLHNIGLRGEGMQTALIDAGFYHYTTLNAFDSINLNGQVLDTWDFVARESSVIEDNSHGMHCLSIIGANLPGQFVGSAPKTSFYLYRTEDVSSEYPIEEHNWVCGAEKADSSGADVISSSLGYSTFDDASLSHSYADLNGNTTMAAIGADMAAKKGLLLFIAVGNEGGTAWHYMLSPADADSVLAVGAVDVYGRKGSFSSFGPTPDGRVKPDIVSVGVGTVIETSSNVPGSGQGTSYACPNIAGVGTCLWQGFREFNNMKIVEALKRSSNSFQHPTDSLGYGIPDVKLAFANLVTDFATSTVEANNCNATLKWSSKDVGAMSFEIERKAPGANEFFKVGAMAAIAGDVLSNHSYEFIDSLDNINSGQVSFRIKQIIDTSVAGLISAYIDTATLSLTSGCNVVTPVITVNKVFIAPNPINDEMNVVVESPSAMAAVLIDVFDMHGRLMLQTSGSKPSGKTTFLLGTSRLARGKYNVVVYGEKHRLATIGVIKL